MNNKVKQTRYYLISYDHDIEEISLGCDNWFFVQMDGSIRYAFGKYGISYPKAVIIDRSYETSNQMDITIVRANIGNKNEMFSWYKNEMFVVDELKRQAECNSSDNYTYKFKII